MVLQFKPTEGLVCKGKDAKPDKAQCFKYQVPGGMVTPIVYRFFKNAWYWSPEPDGSDNFQTCDTTKIADMGLWKVMQFVGVTDVHDENKFVIDLMNDLVPKPHKQDQPEQSYDLRDQCSSCETVGDGDNAREMCDLQDVQDKCYGPAEVERPTVSWDEDGADAIITGKDCRDEPCSKQISERAGEWLDYLRGNLKLKIRGKQATKLKDINIFEIMAEAGDAIVTRSKAAFKAGGWIFVLDTITIGLGVLGMIPLFGMVCDLLASAINIARYVYTCAKGSCTNKFIQNGLLDLLSAVPVVGQGVTLVRFSKIFTGSAFAKGLVKFLKKLWDGADCFKGYLQGIWNTMKTVNLFAKGENRNNDSQFCTFSPFAILNFVLSNILFINDSHLLYCQVELKNWRRVSRWPGKK